MATRKSSKSKKSAPIVAMPEFAPLAPSGDMAIVDDAGVLIPHTPDEPPIDDTGANSEAAQAEGDFAPPLAPEVIAALVAGEPVGDAPAIEPPANAEPLPTADDDLSMGDDRPVGEPAAPAGTTSINSAPRKSNALHDIVKYGRDHDRYMSAANGNLVPPPCNNFAAETHKAFRPRLYKVTELAQAGDLDGLKAMTIKVYCSSSRPLDQYRNLCVLALEARLALATQEAAE